MKPRLYEVLGVRGRVRKKGYKTKGSFDELGFKSDSYGMKKCHKNL
jgi:hypothetical protein